MSVIAEKRVTRTAVLVFLTLGYLPTAGWAQAQVEPPPPAWTWSADGNAFFGYNYQQRHFADFSAWESQNWFMGTGDRHVGNGRLVLQTMISLEPFTIGTLVYGGENRIDAGGSPQLFQTGETYQNVPLVNFQHPHDLIMELGGAYRVVGDRVSYNLGLYLVCEQTLGPPVFMHCESARDNPQGPRTHNFMDSKHISEGVVRGGIEKNGVTLEGSVFRGAEPDENRTNIEEPGLNSWAARIGYRRGPWSAQ